MTLPAPVLASVGGVTVVRDDLLPGGTKRRAFAALLAARPAAEYVYASPAYGYAQLALALAARQAGRCVTIFTAARREWHPLTQAAQAAGARVVGVPHGYLNVVQARARAYANESGAMLLPFGLDCPEASHAIAQAAKALPVSPSEVWCAAGSGTLTRALQAAWPNARHVTVLVGKKDPPTGRAERIAYPRPFASVSRQPPPFPSAANYDAKAWETLQQAQKNRAPRPGVLFWNVAG